MTVYVIGSLKNPKVPLIAAAIREAGFDVFDDWYAAGPEADDYWKAYEQQRGHTYIEGLKGYAAKHVHDFDHFHLIRADLVVLVLPAGKSGHLELGWGIGQGKPGFILLDPEDVRWDVMYRFAKEVVDNVDDLVAALKREIA